MYRLIVYQYQMKFILRIPIYEGRFVMYVYLLHVRIYYIIIYVSKQLVYRKIYFFLYLLKFFLWNSERYH